MILLVIARNKKVPKILKVPNFTAKKCSLLLFLAFSIIAFSNLFF